MNHIGVTLDCRDCSDPSVVIIDGAHYCSGHGLDVTMRRIAALSMVVDLRSAVAPLVGLDPVAVASLAAVDPQAG